MTSKSNTPPPGSTKNNHHHNNNHHGGSNTMNGYFGQTASFLASAAGYMRLPALASTVSQAAGRCMRRHQKLTANRDSQGIAAILTSLLYFKQKCVAVPAYEPRFPAPKCAARSGPYSRRHRCVPKD